MRVEACACCSANCRDSEQPKKRCSFCRFSRPNLLISASQHRTDRQRRTNSKERQRIHNSFLPKNVWNVMIGNCPVKRVTQNSLFPKHNRHETEDCEKSYREYRCLNNRISWGKATASSIARK